MFGALGAVEGAAIVAGTIAAGLLGQATGIIGVLAAQGAGYVMAGLAVIIALRGQAVAGDRPEADRPAPSQLAA